MGPYDNEANSGKGEYLFDDAVKNAHWVANNETNMLSIIARDADGFEGYGPDEDEEALFSLSDAELEDHTTMERLGFSIIPMTQRGFNSEIGFYF
jgi:hypothetical protein